MTEMTATSTPLGASIRRREDPRLLQGQGRYVGDLRLPGQLYAAFVRSPHAHARVSGLSLDAARARPGVVAALGPGDLPVLARPVAPTFALPGFDARLAAPLATEEVRYVGEAVAMVVADSPYRAADAAEAVTVDYEALPVVVDPEHAQEEGALLVHPNVSRNVAGRLRRGMGDVAAAFAGADVVLRERLTTARAAGAAIEPRAVAAQPGGDGEVTLTLWASTQAPHALRHGIAQALDLPDEGVRVITADVGGGFGPKGRLYAEDIVVAALAVHLGRPVLWQATRQEDLLTTYLGRGLVVDAEVAAAADGTIRGVRVRLTQDCGAYLPTSVIVPLNAAQHILGPYRLPAYEAEIVGVYTHKVPLTPLRGGGREQGVFVMERLLDHLARALGRDPIDLRRQNVLRPDEFPHDTGYPAFGQGTVIYDSGDYPAALERARALSGYDAVRRAQPAERRAGRYRGVAVTAFLESTGAGQESARVEVAADGTIQVTVGSPSNGQGHATTLAQVCAARLGVPVERVVLTSGDTAAMDQGTGTFGSRMAVMAGNAVAQAAAELRRQVLTAAADLLEVAVSDLEFTDGVIAVRGVPGRNVDLAQLAQLHRAHEGSPPLCAAAVFAPDTPTCFAGGAHAAVVAVDVETGVVEVERYIVVHDCGTVINPMIVEGQVHGGVAHGVGNALWEAMVYDAAGQLLSADFPDYALPQAPWIPPIEVAHQEHPSPYNPEGIKGAGEGGTIGALATIAGAIEDALAPLRLTLNDLPIRSEELAWLCRPLREG